MEVRPGEHLKIDLQEVGNYNITFKTTGTEAVLVLDGNLINASSTSLKGEYFFTTYCGYVPNFIIVRNMGNHSITNLNVVKE